MLKSYFHILILLFIYINLSLNAQPGIKFGLNISALQSSTEDFRPFLGYEVSWLQYGTSNPVFGLQAGIFYTFRFSDYFSFQTEINYAQKGYQFDHTPLYDSNYKLDITYLELPLLIIYKLPFGWDFYPQIIAGPSTSLKIGSDKKIKISNGKKTGIVSSVRDFEFGIIFGIVSDFDILNGQLIFDLRVNWGFSNIMSSPPEFINLYADPGTVKTRSIVLTTGYRFKLN